MKALALFAALSLSGAVSGQIVPGYNLEIRGSVSVIDIGGKPCLAILGKPGTYPGGLVTFWNTQLIGPAKEVALTALWGGVYDPRPCAPGGKPWLHVSTDCCSGTADMPFGYPRLLIGFDGYGLGFQAPVLGLRMFHGALGGGAYTPYRIDYSWWTYTTVYSTSPCGGDADLLQCLVCEVALK